MSNYKEIVTKAVIGKAKKITHNEFEMNCEETPNTVLGCWVINHTFKGTNENNKVRINGDFDINVWYSFDNDTKTKVKTERYNYDDIMSLSLKDNAILDNESEVIVRSLKQPTVTDVRIVDNSIYLKVEKELGVEVVGNAKIKVNILEDDDDYEVLSENESLSDNIDDIKEEFLDA